MHTAREQRPQPQSLDHLLAVAPEPLWYGVWGRGDLEGIALPEAGRREHFVNRRAGIGVVGMPAGLVEQPLASAVEGLPDLRPPKPPRFPPWESSQRTSPAVGGMAPARVRARIDLPDPAGPTIAQCSPSRRVQSRVRCVWRSVTPRRTR